MSIEQQEATVWLQRAFESYLKGETPSPLDLARAPLLEDWSVAVVRIKRDAEQFRMLPVLVGRVAGHPQLGDARTIRTSQLIFLDRHRQWARTWNRVYRLGQPADDGIEHEGA